MRHEAEKTCKPCLRLKAPAVELQSGRVQMFESAAATQIHDECVILIRQFAEDLISLLDDLRNFGRDLRAVVISLTAENEPVRLAFDREIELREVAHLERRIE